MKKSSKTQPLADNYVRRALQGNHADTARLLGVTSEGLRKMLKRGAPVLRGGGRGVEAVFDWPQVIQWRMQDLSKGRGDAELTAERTKLAAAQAAKIVRENRIASGDLVSLSATVAVFSEMVLMLRNLLLGLPVTLAPELAGTDDPHVCRAIVDREIRHALVTISEWTPADLPSVKRARKNGEQSEGDSGHDETARD